MSILGLVNPGSFLKKVQRETAQDQSAPLLKPKSDKLILLCASTIPILTLMLTIFFEPNVFVMNDLEIYNPESMYSYLTDVPYIKSYCWTHLQHVDESGRTISLIHYRLFPYILLFLAILILPAKMTWKFVTTENLINVMDYILDAIEESIRDVIEFIIDDSKEMEKRTNLNKNQIITSAATENYHTISNQFYQRYQNRRTELNKSYKFVHFDDIIRGLSKGRHYINIVRMIRMFLLITLVFTNATIYWLFLIPEQNPSIFNCPLPPQYTNQTNVVEVTFTAVENRKVIMWATFTLNNLLIGGCCLTWLFYPKCNSSALRLLRQLPLADNVEIPDSYSDLHFILELVHLNRNRLTFVRLAFQILGVVESTGSDLQESNLAFMSVFQEATGWSLSDDGKTNSIVSKLVNNLEHIPEK